MREPDSRALCGSTRRARSSLAGEREACWANKTTKAFVAPFVGEFRILWYLVYFLSYFVFLQQTAYFPIPVESESSLTFSELGSVRVIFVRNKFVSIRDRCMTRSSSNNLHDLEPEIDRTLHRLRKMKNTNVGSSDSFNSISNSVDNSFATNSEFPDCSNSSFYVKTRAHGESRSNMERVGHVGCGVLTLVHLVSATGAGSVILAQSYELKSGLIHLLPKFHDLASEDPHKHLKEFHVVCSTMRPQGILEDYIKMKAFPFSLDGVAKDWLYLQLVLFHTWGDMKHMFLEKFFLTSRTTTIRNKICEIRQQFGETLHEY
ncbi:hypothetical protein CR513_22643, partial [Mucuna pruriens]